MPQCEVMEKSFPHDIPSLRRNAHAYLHAAPIVAKLYPRAQYFLDRERNAYDIMYKLVRPQYHHFLQGIHSRDLTRLESGEEHTDVRTKLDTTQTKKPHRAGKLHTAIEKVNVESSLPKVPRAPREKRRVPSRSKGLSHLEDQSHRNSERMVHRSHSSLLQHPVEGEKRSSSRAESVRFGVPLPPPVIPHVPRGLGAPLSRPDSDLVAKVTTQQMYDWLLKVRTIPCERIPEAETVSHWASWDVGQHWKRGVINKEKSTLKTHSNEYPQSSKNGVRLEVHHNNKRVNQVASEKKDLLMNNPAAGVDVCRQIAGGKLSIQDPYRTRVRQRCIESTYMDAMKSMSLFLRK